MAPKRNTRRASLKQGFTCNIWPGPWGWQLSTARAADCCRPRAPPRLLIPPKHGRHPGGESISQVINEGRYFLPGQYWLGVRPRPAPPGREAAFLEMLTENSAPASTLREARLGAGSFWHHCPNSFEPSQNLDSTFVNGQREVWMPNQSFTKDSTIEDYNKKFNIWLGDKQRKQIGGQRK